MAERIETGGASGSRGLEFSGVSDFQENNPESEALDSYVALKKAGSDIQRASKKIDNLKTELRDHAMMGSGFLSSSLNPFVTEHYRQIEEAQNARAELQTKEEKLKADLKRSADAVHHEIRSNNQEAAPLLTEGRLGSAMAALGQWDEAEEHFNNAAKEAGSLDLDLEAADFRFQSLLTQSERGADWETQAKRLEAFFQETNREVQLRQKGPEDFSIWLEERGDAESWRTLRAEALGAFIELYVKHGKFNAAPLQYAIETLRGYINEAKDHAGPEEGQALMEAQELALQSHMARAYQLGADGKVGELDSLFQRLTRDTNNAAKLAVHHPDHREIQETLGKLRGLTYFHFWKEAGLPSRGVFSFWEEAGKNGGTATHSEDNLKKLIQKKAPHFFDIQGNLLAREKISLPKNSDVAAYAEASLHNDDASLTESLVIGGGTALAGATGGAKLGGGAGLLCGPFAEFCAPLGAFLGGVAGYFGGDKILKEMHASAQEQFVNDTKMAGLGLSRISLHEANQQEATQALLMLAGLGMMGVAANPMGRSGQKLATGLGWALRKETWGYFGQRIASESRYTVRWIKALGIGARGFFRKTDKTAVEATIPQVTFEDVWQQLAPWQLAKGRSYWSPAWGAVDQMPRGATPAVAAKTAPLIDRVLGPLNKGWDNSFGTITRLGSNRLQAIRHAVLSADPGLSYKASPLIARKEMMRANVLIKNGVDFANGSGTIKWPAFEWTANWMRQNVGTVEFEKAHRLGLPIAVTGLFYDSDGDKGGGWVPWDGELDSGWEFAPFFLWSNNASKVLFDNKVLGADIAGAINLFTIDRMLSLSDYEGATDYDRFRGAHLHYFVATAANSLFLSGLHYAKGFPLGQLVGSVPFARRLPSMTSFPSAFRLGSTWDKPNFFTVSGLGLTLFYQSYLTGYHVSDVFSNRRLINADPYYSLQRTTKYAVAVPPINAAQAAFGYRTTLGQTVGRLAGILPDLALARVFPPFLNKGRYENKEERLLEEETDASLDNAWNVFVDANTSLDLGGVVGRMADEEALLAGPKHWKAIRVGHWRWEPRGVETWTSPESLKSLDGRKGFIEQLAEARDHKKLAALTEMYRQQFLDPDAPWRTNTNEQHGMMIFAFIAKYFAQKAIDGEYEFQSFLHLIKKPELSTFFRSLPIPKNHAELLQYVTQVDEGQFLWILQKAPKNPQEKQNNGEPAPMVIVLRQEDTKETGKPATPAN